MSFFAQKNNRFEIENPLSLDNFEVKNSKQDNEEKKKKGIWLWTIFSLFFAILIGRSFFLQVVKGKHFQEIAESNRIREEIIPAPRGIIKDTFGEILAQNIPSYDLVFVPFRLPNGDIEKNLISKNLSPIIETDWKEIKNKIIQKTPDPNKAYLLKNNLAKEKAFAIIENQEKFSGIYLAQSAKRQYNEGDLFSHLIGYDGKINEKELKDHPHYSMIENIGKDGIEKSYEKFIHGTPGIHRYEVNSTNKIIKDLGHLPPKSGNEIVLSLDAKLQKEVHQILQKIISQNKDATGAAAVIIDPRNGKIRSLVSLPTFDNNLFSGGISKENYASIIENENNPLLNKAVSGEYAPGSTFKPIVALAALEEKIITKNTSLNCPGHISIGQWNFPDWKTHGHTDLKKAIAESCNVFFYAVGGGWENISALGIGRINQYAKMFGFGAPLGIDLPAEQDGLIPDETWKFKQLGEKWYIGDSYHASIGQGYLSVTPLQLAAATATIANHGTLYRPQIVEKIKDTENGIEKNIEPSVISNVFVSEENFKIVKEGMRETVVGEHGSARLLNSLEVSSAGKTGTAQFGTNEKIHSWYISFAPFEKPELAMAILIEGGGEGHDWAVPATRDIYQWYFDWERGEKMPEDIKHEITNPKSETNSNE